MGGALPAGLLCAVAGMMLAFAPLRQALAGGAALVAAALIVHGIGVFGAATTAALSGCWISLLGCALCIYWRRPPAPALLVVLAANAGLWAGLVGAANGSGNGLWLVIAATALGVPAMLLVRHGYAIVPRVITSWLLAVAMIAAVLPHVVSHPGYVPDHMQ